MGMHGFAEDAPLWVDNYMKLTHPFHRQNPLKNLPLSHKLQSE